MPKTRRVRRLLPAVLAVSLIAAAPASAEPPPIDDYAYDHATHCVKRPTPGALALVDWLGRNARGVSWGIMRCEKWGKKRASLHAEGRAVDWHLDVAKPADRRAARRLIDRLLATDRLGNPHALARRMGSRRSSGTAARGGQAPSGWAPTRLASTRR